VQLIFFWQFSWASDRRKGWILKPTQPIFNKKIKEKFVGIIASLTKNQVGLGLNLTNVLSLGPNKSDPCS